LHLHYLARQLSSRHEVRAVALWDNNRTDWLLGTTLRASSVERDYTVDGIPVRLIGFSAVEKARLLPPVIGYYAIQSVAIDWISNVLARKMLSLSRDVDIVQNGRIGREPISYASLNVARRLGVPFFLTPYHHPRWKGWLYRHFIRLYRLADGLIALTNAERQMLGALGVNMDKVFVTGMGPIVAQAADGERFLVQTGLTNPFVLFLGQHYSYKGFHELLRAAPRVWKRVPEAQFVFIGPAVGHSERLFKEADDRRIRRLGTLDLQLKSDALAACDVLCVPSLQESFGGVYTEAWVFGKPVIGCDIPAVSEVIENGVNGFLVDQRPDQIADRICELLLSPGVARRMGEAGRKKVQSQFTWEKIAARTEAAYSSVLQGQASA
jgi:glycosyltransferase involved in cell wall biosynthesis